MAGQTSTEIAETEFSSLLEALSTSPKGRSFLNEYRRRSRPEETRKLLEALARIEASVGAIRDQLRPAEIAGELRRIGMTLDIAVEGMQSDPDGDQAARRTALIHDARSELSALANSLTGEIEPTTAEDRRRLGRTFATIEEELALVDQAIDRRSPRR